MKFFKTSKVIKPNSDIGGGVIFDKNSEDKLSETDESITNINDRFETFGSAKSAIKLYTARKIGNTDFDGSKDISLSDIGAEESGVAEKYTDNKIGDLNEADVESDSKTNIISIINKIISLISTHINNKVNPHEVTKTQVGLDKVDNTADSDKSVKYATTAGSANAVAWDKVTSKPSTYPPASHSHSYLPLTGGTVTGNFIVSKPKGSHSYICLRATDGTTLHSLQLFCHYNNNYMGLYNETLKENIIVSDFNGNTMIGAASAKCVYLKAGVEFHTSGAPIIAYNHNIQAINGQLQAVTNDSKTDAQIWANASSRSLILGSSSTANWMYMYNAKLGINIIANDNSGNTCIDGKDLVYTNKPFYANNTICLNSNGVIHASNASWLTLCAGVNGVNVKRFNAESTWMPISASSFNTISSRLVKENIQNLSEEEAKKILNVRVVRFDYKEEVGGQKKSTRSYCRRNKRNYSKRSNSTRRF